MVNFRKYVGFNPTYFGNASTVIQVGSCDGKESLTERALKVGEGLVRVLVVVVGGGGGGGKRGLGGREWWWWW